jgi:hypothetical protein
LQPGINPTSNKSMLEAADEQQIDAAKYLREDAIANLMRAIDSATLATSEPLLFQEVDTTKTRREELYADDFRVGHRDAPEPCKKTG